jgi:cob(I)alamin adenosyltransferase
MSHRLSKITTRTGDKGDTGLGDGSRVAKDSVRIQALGDVDELNSSLGLLLSEPLPADVREALVAVQHDLFDLGGEIAVPGYTCLTERQIGRLEDQLARWNRDLPALKEFILPGGARPAALAHLVRTMCRRAERSVVTLARAENENINENISDSARIYLNRLSDLMFVLGRVLNRAAGGSDVLWEQGKNR